MNTGDETEPSIDIDHVEVLYHDEHIVAVSKPSGILVHPYKSRSNQRKTLMSVTRDQIGQYVYPIHRLDRPVSGVIMFGLSSRAVKIVKDRWHTHETKKEYIALCLGVPPEEGKFDFPLQNEQKVKQDALTEFWPIYNFDDKYSLVKVRIHTGRKHQIRRHFSRTRHNIIGDTTYGQGKVNHQFQTDFSLMRIFLHAYLLEFVHPFENKKISLVSPLSSDLVEVLKKMNLPAENFENL